MTVASVELVNCLPSALSHYEVGVERELTAAGLRWFRGAAVSIERETGADGSRKPSTAIRVCYERMLQRREAVSERLILWPALGYLELGMWRRAQALRNWLVIHDPLPLRRQVGLGKPSIRIGRLLQQPNMRIVVHSDGARRTLEAIGLRADLQLPLPMTAPLSPRGRERSVVVLGQYKDARNLRLLEALAPRLKARGLQCRIFGRGWPALAGWDVASQYLSERSFDDVLGAAGCLLLPYRQVFQSEVAVRAAQLSVPVVGPRQSNLSDVFGEGWVGTVTGESVAAWTDCIETAVDVEADAVFKAAKQGYERSRRAWAGWIDSLQGY